jgi:putative SOS response-associated peptidase YedK
MRWRSRRLVVGPEVHGRQAEMCGRLENTLTMADYQSLFNVTPCLGPTAAPYGLGPLFDLEPLPDIRPTDRVPIILPGNDQLEMKLARWGFSTPAGALRQLSLFNARDDKLEQSPIWREGFHSRRCLVPATAFFEWSGIKGAKVKHRIGLSSGRGFGMAGIWQTTDDGLEFTVITTTPNEVVAELHDRMPVIVKPRDYEHWLADVPDLDDLRAILRKYPAAKTRSESSSNVLDL